MRYIPRRMGHELKTAAKHFPALIVTGPRRAGKTTLVRKSFPRAPHYLLEDPDMIARIRNDPRSLLDDITPPAILDEIQHVPELLNYIRSRIDAAPHSYGQWLLTGSQEAPLMRGVSESMAGRAGVFQLWPFSQQETDKVSILRGGFPDVLAHPRVKNTWFRSYVQTYLERDVRAISAIKDLATFRRFLALVASRCGQMLNRADLAAPLGISVPTVSEWLNILEITSQLILVQPFFESFGKRIVKSPKMYFADSGLVCHLLGIETEATLSRSPFSSALVENFVAAEIVKMQCHAGQQKALYYFRDQQGLEVDFIVPTRHQTLLLLEAKATRTVRPQMANSLQRLQQAVANYDTHSYVIHLASQRAQAMSTIAPGVKTVSLDALPRLLEN